MKVRDYMTIDIVYGTNEDTVEDLSRKMKEYQIGFLPIVENQKIVGVLTDRDIVIQMLANEDKKNTLDYCKNHIICVSEDADLEEALEQMKEHKVKRILAVQDDKVTGILSLSDILQTDTPSLLETIRSIFTIEHAKREKSAEIDSFYL